MARHTAALALVALALCAAAPALVRGQDACASLFGVTSIGNFSVIMNADPGEFSGTPEAKFFLENLVNTTIVPKNKSVCAEIVKGKLMGQDVALILTGIGPTAAGYCTLSFLMACGDHVTELIYSGTSGWSPQVGGTFPNPPSCDTANNKTANITRVGDLCVSPLAINWNCRQASWSQQASGWPNQCFRPNQTFGPQASFLYGECIFYKDNLLANLQLSLDVLMAMAEGANNFPMRSAEVGRYETEYWALTANATGFTYPYGAKDTVTIWGFDQCAEEDGQFFWSGAPWETLARDDVAATMSMAFNTTVTSADVIVVSAMEAIGVAEALEKYHKLATTTRMVPYTNVRGMSNWVNKPPTKVAPGVWGAYELFDMPFSLGYEFAIATYSAGIMTYYQSKCTKGVAAGTLPAATNCTFTVTYP